ncbi:MAG: peptidoglycan DD-metalloendopeptidase family protein [Pseudomonadales bacterium]|nr:peptidoglycan DD-metalloendopeptidase family protein [Pseudomonadales bacterium]
MRLSWRLLLSVFLLTSLAACSPRGVVPLEDRYRSAAPVNKGIHVVRKGDTLFSIAWRYHRDYKELARNNGIKYPYRIHPGQRISLYKASKKVTKTNKTKPRNKKATKTSRYKKSVNNAKPVQEKVANQLHKKVNISFSWPAKGSVVQRFSSRGKVNKGINIAGKRGDPVFAAAQGVVVYSGPGLVGYGNLIIIKHNETFLSAYAHNHRLLVKEGQRVKAKQKIAEIGSTGTTKTLLHFEIRKRGKPVDPMWYLPKR